MWTPTLASSALNRGAVAGVAVVMMSASRTAAPAFFWASPPMRSASASALAGVRLQTITRSMGRTARTAAIWSAAIAPAPSMAMTEALAGASSLVARPAPAAVRMAVRVGPSTIPRGLPSSPNATTMPAGLPGTVDTTLTPVTPPTRPGMNRDPANRVRCGYSVSSPNARSMAAMASGIGRASRVADASR